MATQEAAYQSLQGPLYSARQVGVTSFIFGPLGGALLLRANYRALNNNGAATKALLWSAAATALLVIILLELPFDLPRSVAPAIYGAVMYQVHVRLQGEAFKAHVGAGGRQQSWWRAILLGVVGLVATLVIAFAVGAVMP